LQKAADHGYAPAQTALGNLYFQGNCVARDSAQVLTWTRKAADQGYPAAQYFLGTLYVSGDGIKIDYKEALHWFLAALDQQAFTIDPVGRTVTESKASALFYVGVIYEAGLGVPRDAAQAVNWYQKAAELGNAKASARLAELRQSPAVKSGTINLACVNDQGKILVLVDAGRKTVSIQAPTVVEYKDDKKQYVTVTDTSIEFGCRVQTDEAKLTGEIGANLLFRGNRGAELAEKQACLMRHRIDRATGVWRSDTGNYVVTANCTPLATKR
jgi:TPR repeat protein